MAYLGFHAGQAFISGRNRQVSEDRAEASTVSGIAEFDFRVPAISNRGATDILSESYDLRDDHGLGESVPASR